MRLGRVKSVVPAAVAAAAVVAAAATVAAAAVVVGGGYGGGGWLSGRRLVGASTASHSRRRMPLARRLTCSCPASPLRRDTHAIDLGTGVLAVFRSFMVSAGEMLCFHGPQLEKHGPTLRQLTEKNLVIKEQFAGGYSLTRAGFEAMAGPAAKAPSPQAAEEVRRQQTGCTSCGVASKPAPASHSARRR